MYKIGLDIMGGDNAPHDHIKASIKFAKENDDVELHLFGSSEYKQQFHAVNNIVFHETTEVIENCEEPVKAIKKKKDSSLVVGTNSVVNNEIDCIISSGSTGAIVASGVFIAKRIKGIDRPALPILFPNSKKKSPKCILDVGATIDTKPQHIVQHAKIARIYLESVYDVVNPDVKLLNIGEESSKGTEIYKETYKLLQENNTLNFTGNIEPRDILFDESDVIVCDGFTGNVVLKTLEGTLAFMSNMLNDVFYSSLSTKLAGLTVKSKINERKSAFDYKKIGATPVLGVKELILKAHGSSNDIAIYSALAKSKQIIDSNYIEKVEKSLEMSENNVS